MDNARKRFHFLPAQKLLRGAYFRLLNSPSYQAIRKRTCERKLLVCDSIGIFYTMWKKPMSQRKAVQSRSPSAADLHVKFPMPSSHDWCTVRIESFKSQCRVRPNNAFWHMPPPSATRSTVPRRLCSGICPEISNLWTSWSAPCYCNQKAWPIFLLMLHEVIVAWMRERLERFDATVLNLLWHRRTDARLSCYWRRLFCCRFYNKVEHPSALDIN